MPEFKMLSLEQLVFYANYFNYTPRFLQILKFVDRDEKWTQSDGFSYCALDAHERHHLAGRHLPDLFDRSGAEVEIVRIEGVVRPHAHAEHDAVAICKEIPTNTRSLSGVWTPWGHSNGGGWEVARNDQFLLIPRNTLHGFTKQMHAGVNSPPFYLIIVNNARFIEGDIQYPD